MSGEIQLPDMIDQDAQHVEFRIHQCAECRENGPVALAQNPDWWTWGDEHTALTGHKKFYQWTLTRNAGQMPTVNAPRRPARRALGKRSE